MAPTKTRQTQDTTSLHVCIKIAMAHGASGHGVSRRPRTRGMGRFKTAATSGHVFWALLQERGLLRVQAGPLIPVWKCKSLSWMCFWLGKMPQALPPFPEREGRRDKAGGGAQTAPLAYSKEASQETCPLQKEGPRWDRVHSLRGQHPCNHMT